MHAPMTSKADGLMRSFGRCCLLFLLVLLHSVREEDPHGGEYFSMCLSLVSLRLHSLDCSHCPNHAHEKTGQASRHNERLFLFE